MDKNIKDYLPFYLGCDVIGQYDGDRKGYLTGVINGGVGCEIQFFEEDGINVFEEPEYNTPDEVQLVLRPLSDMTDEEKSWAILNMPYKTQKSEDLFNHILYEDAEVVRKLLSKHFDLFGLIESGLAIDKTTLQ